MYELVQLRAHRIKRNDVLSHPRTINDPREKNISQTEILLPQFRRGVIRR